MSTTTAPIFLKDAHAFESVFKSYYASLASFACQYVSDKEEAEEIVQEMFTNLWAKGDQIRIQTTVKSYLFGATRNACLNHLKRKKVAKKYEDRQLWVAKEEQEIDFLELDQLHELIEAAMNKIPEKCREIFELSRSDGKKYQEIADELQISIKTVENQMGKALRILREELQDYLPSILFWLSAMGVNAHLIVELV